MKQLLKSKILIEPSIDTASKPTLIMTYYYLNRLAKTTDTQTGTIVENTYLGMKRVTKTVTHLGGQARSGAAPETAYFIGDSYEVLPNSETRTYIHADLGGSQPLHIATIENKGGTETINYIHSDHLGSSGLVTDERGDIVELTSYFPYGEVRHDTTNGTFDERHEFTGYEGSGETSGLKWSGLRRKPRNGRSHGKKIRDFICREKRSPHWGDGETGLNYANARYYDSEMGRFISQDFVSVFNPMEILDDPQQLHLYAYARNNPFKYTDPTGLKLSPAARAKAFRNMNNFLKTSGYQRALRLGGNPGGLEAIYGRATSLAQRFGVYGSSSSNKERITDSLRIFSDTVSINLDKSFDSGTVRGRRIENLPDGLTGASGSNIKNKNNPGDTGNTDKLQHFSSAALLSAEYGRGLATSLGEVYESLHAITAGFSYKDLVANELGAMWGQALTGK
ncbi:MAG: RHS repeat-associated core domain-containing protein, partial [bacterium]|nr:RHS repeat-associated core domain-containing protein [bacterium]